MRYKVRKLFPIIGTVLIVVGLCGCLYNTAQNFFGPDTGVATRTVLFVLMLFGFVFTSLGGPKEVEEAEYGVEYPLTVNDSVWIEACDAAGLNECERLLRGDPDGLTSTVPFNDLVKAARKWKEDNEDALFLECP